MKRLLRNTSENLDAIFCMSGIRGKNIKVEKNLPFSFYYSTKNSSHGPRIKPIFDPTKVNKTKMGTLKLCDDWSYIPGEDDNRVPSSEINELKQFARKYLILFLLVWENKTPDELALSDYLQGDISIEEFVKELDFYKDYSKELDGVYTVQDLENVCREHDLVNFYGN